MLSFISFFYSKDFTNSLKPCLTVKELCDTVDKQLEFAGLLPPNLEEFEELVYEMFEVSTDLIDNERVATEEEEALFIATWRFSKTINIWAERLIVSIIATAQTHWCNKILVSFVPYDKVMSPISAEDMFETGELPN